MNLTELKVSNERDNAIILGPSFERSNLSIENEHSRYEPSIRTPSSNCQQQGRSRRLAVYRGTQSISYSGDGHLMTIAPTGSGKGRSVIIPNLLNYQGSVITIDPKGENFAVTSRRRKEMGQKVICIDPFGVLGNQSDGINPLDILTLDGADVETDAQMLAQLLSSGKSSTREPFWDLSSRGLISGLITYIATQMPIEERNLNSVRKLLINDNILFNLATILDDSGNKMNRMAYDEIAAFLQMPDRDTRPSVLATAISYFKLLISERVAVTLQQSSFPLAELVTGKPLSIYLIIPPNKLRSHGSLLSLWIGTLLQAITSRRTIPKQRTLFILDECAQLGCLDFLETVITLCRGYGLQTWSFWQDLGQIKMLYPASWSTMINNCAVIQFFGAKNYLSASEFAAIVGLETDVIRNLKSHEQVLLVNGEKATKANLCDYLNNPQFRGLFDRNPFY